MVEMTLFGRPIDSVLRTFLEQRGEPERSPRYPALNLWEDRETVFAEAELPGFAIQDLEISVTGDLLTVAGERKLPSREGSVCHRREREFGAFVRTVRLPAAVDADRVQASLKNGILAITLPKSERAKPRRIEVKSAL